MRITLALLLALVPGSLLAADVDLSTRIDEVTVFPDAATVTRIGRAELPAGATALILRGLPASIDPASIRVDGKGTAPFTIGGVDVRTVPGEARPAADPELEARIVAAREARDTVAARVAALDVKKGSIERYAQASPERLGPEGAALDPGQWAKAWDAVGTALADVNEALRGARARMRELDADIAALERARPTPPRPGAPKRDVAVAVEAAEPVSADLRVSYRVTGASWSAGYDARLDTGGADRKPALELLRRALVVQRTGEDWSDVALSVSTARVNRSAAAPDLPPLQVSFYEPPMAYRERALGAPPPAAAPRAPEQAARADLAEPRPAETRAKVEATVQQAAVEAGAFQATFRVPGRVTVPADGTSKALALGSRRAEPQLTVTVTPELDETAYLKATFTHEEEAPLLPGEVSLQRDGSFIGRTRLKLTPSGDQVELGFGADDRVKVARVPLRRRENEPGWIGQTKTDLREFKTSVRNLHARPMRITVTDRLPFSENTAITVEQLRETTAPTEKGPNDRRGVLAWSYDYAPGEAREIRLAYRLRWPADRDVVFEARPNIPPRS